MKQLTNVNVSNFQEAVNAAQEAIQNGQRYAFSGGGTDLLQQIKDGTDLADIIINLRTVDVKEHISSSSTEVSISGVTTLSELADNAKVTANLTAIAQAAGVVATPQIRNVGTVAGNVTQRPWCWYYRNGFNCFKAGGDECFAANGENGQHAIFGGGPSFIVHPSDVAPALVAFDAIFQVSGPNGDRELSSGEFFILPRNDPAKENALEPGELLTEIRIPLPQPGTVSTYNKIMDRAAWTHAEVGVAIVMQRDGNAIENARVVLSGVAPIPWRAQAVEAFLEGKQINQDVAHEAGLLAIAQAQPLAKNRHKLPMTVAAIEDAILSLAAV